jgi:hypothetical protein
MRSAGMSGKALTSWKTGARLPRRDSVLALGQTLILRGEKMIELGRELVGFVRSEEQRLLQSSHDSSKAPDLFEGVVIQPVRPTCHTNTTYGDRGRNFT